MRLRLFISVVLLAAYSLNHGAWARVPRILCQGEDGHQSIELAGELCCRSDANTVEDVGCADAGLPSVGSPSCGECTDSELPAPNDHRAAFQQGITSFALAAPAADLTLPAALLLTMSDLPDRCEPASSPGGFTILRC